MTCTNRANLRGSLFSFITCLVLALTPASLRAAEVDQAELIARLEALEAWQAQFQTVLQEKDARIDALEKQLASTSEAPPVAVSSADPTLATIAPAVPEAPAVPGATASEQHFGRFQPGGQGFKLADTPWGDVNFSLWAYVRYLNQQGLDDQYTDAFGRTRSLDLRNDLQVNKVNLYFKGWVLDPRFRYLFYTWTANTSQGDGAQVVVAGNMGYQFNKAFELSAGIGALPGTRSLQGTFPYWLKVDNRPIGDEFFRPSYTTGIWAGGALTDALHYKVMLGNNLSQLGVSAAQLDDKLNTVSAALWWMPTTGEFGPAGGYGDFEHHDSLATTFGARFTHSREDRQSQPDTEGIENTQLRLSDGTVIFEPGAFGTNGQINKATYQMASLDAGLKYRGLSLHGEYYFRWLDDFDVVGDIPVSKLYDHGFQLQASAMLMPKKLQTYLAGSKIFGEYGDPWDISAGLNWFPTGDQLFRLNTELLYLKDSPVGYSSVPFQVGGDGVVFNANLELMF